MIIQKMLSVSQSKRSFKFLLSFFIFLVLASTTLFAYESKTTLKVKNELEKFKQDLEKETKDAVEIEKEHMEYVLSTGFLKKAAGEAKYWEDIANKTKTGKEVYDWVGFGKMVVLAVTQQWLLLGVDVVNGLLIDKAFDKGASYALSGFDPAKELAGKLPLPAQEAIKNAESIAITNINEEAKAAAKAGGYSELEYTKKLYRNWATSLNGEAAKLKSEAKRIKDALDILGN